MQMRILLSVAAAMLLAISCLNRAEPFGDPPLFDNFLLVDTGYTPAYTPWGIGEYSSFGLHWNVSEGAAYYVIKYSPVPVTLDNWDDILVSDTVPGTVDSAYVFVQPSVFQNVCISCGLCVDACPHDAITLQGDGRAVIDVDLCTSCGECVRICPVKAIEDSNFGQTYYFGVRAFSSTGMPSNVIAVSSTPYKIIYYNDPLWCGRCEGNLPGGGDWSGCWIINTNTEPDGSGESTGPGCPVDAIWQDSTYNYMVYIDYDKCIHCGICFLECKDYGLQTLRKRVVPGWFIPDVPEPPAR